MFGAVLPYVDWMYMARALEFSVYLFTSHNGPLPGMGRRPVIEGRFNEACSLHLESYFWWHVPLLEYPVRNRLHLACIPGRNNQDARIPPVSNCTLTFYLSSPLRMSSRNFHQLPISEPASRRRLLVHRAVFGRCSIHSIFSTNVKHSIHRAWLFLMPITLI